MSRCKCYRIGLIKKKKLLFTVAEPIPVGEKWTLQREEEWERRKEVGNSSTARLGKAFQLGNVRYVENRKSSL